MYEDRGGKGPPPHLTAHPVSEGTAGVFHAVIAALYLFALWYHAMAAWRHLKERVR